MTPKEFEQFMIALFQNNGNEKIAKYVYMTPADNTVIPVIHALRKKIEVSFNDDTGNILTLGEEAQQALYNIYEAELRRIMAFQKTSSKVQKEVKGYKDGADKFLLFPFLNKEIQEKIVETEGKEGESIEKNALSAIWESNGSIVNPLSKTQKMAIMSLIEKHVIAEINLQVARWADLGIFKKSENKKTPLSSILN